MNILLIQPTFNKNTLFYRFSWKFTLEIPYALQYLAAIIPKEYNLKLINENQEKINFDEEADIIGLSCISANVDRGYEIADEFRKRGKTVILGGYHPTAMPEEAKKHADCVVIGDSETLWPKLIQDFKTNKLKPFYTQDATPYPEIIPSLRRDLFKGIYLFAPIEATRGCQNRCKFCSITHTKKYYIKRRVEDVISEIKTIKHKIISFYDPSLISDVEYATTLLNELKKLNKKILCQGTIDILSKNEKLIKLSKDAGCIGWNIGLETISQKNIKDISKTTNIVNTYKPVIKKIKSYGMDISGGIVFGFDNDTPDIFDDTLELIYDWDIDIVGFHILTPFPGTPLFRQFENEDRILTRDWSKYDLEHVVFKPKNMSPEELEEGIRNISRKFYSASNLTKNIFKFHRFGFYPYLHLMSTWIPGVLFNPLK